MGRFCFWFVEQGGSYFEDRLHARSSGTGARIITRRTRGKKMSTVRALTAAQRRDIELELRDELARLERSIDSQAEEDRGAVEASDALFDPTDVNGGLAVRLETRATERMEAIRAALARLADGTYGICSGCGSRIPYGRLIVMPESTLCVACGRV